MHWPEPGLMHCCTFSTVHNAFLHLLVVETIIVTQTYKAVDKAFLGVANMWHLSENKVSEDLIFIVSWLGEKDKPLAVLE